MKKFLFLLLFTLTTLPVFAKNNILIVGDSISAGYGIEISQGWVQILRQHIASENYPYEVINASISGDTTSNGMTRLKPALSLYKPTITIIELGGNDGLRGLPLTTIQNNLAQMITLALKAKSQVILLGVRLPPNYGPAYIQQFQAIYHTLAKQYNVALVPLFLNKIDEHHELMQADGIHPTAKAQILLFNNVWPVLKKLLVR